MTDKQIIIDGVDVAGCEDYGYRGKAGYWCHYYDEPCTDYPNCYYKQLKRKEQRIVELNKTIKAKEQENEELKKQHQSDKGLITSTGKMNYQLIQEYDKLKTALTEIKEIAEKQCVCGVYCIDMKQILQKISEVEND